jgi:Mg2+-importing ATPase
MNQFPDFTLSEFAGQTNSEVILQLRSDGLHGLSEKEARQRIKDLGANIFLPKKKSSRIKDLLHHFKSPLVILLVIATALSYTFGEPFNATIILVMIITSVLIDYYQENDARNAGEKLKQTIKTKVIAIRDGLEKEIFIEELCLGDIILLNAGKIVPADARIINSKDFFVNQSSLTGESFPSEKISDPVRIASPDLQSLNNIIFLGSSVISGSCKAIVIKTGIQTEFGKIAETLIQRDEDSDFSHGLRNFGYLIMKVTVVLVLFIFLVNALLKHDIIESFLFSIAIAVGLTPELLPMIMSISMAKGSLQMAKKGVIVKHLPAIPNFGSMEVLCTDKTGTITEDKIKLIKYVDLNGALSEQVFELAYLNSFYQTGIKNPLDDAILSFKKIDITGNNKVDEIPFDFYRKRMSVVFQKNQDIIIICKGAPEEILKSCTISQEWKRMAQTQYDALSSDGFRVLAIAIKHIEHKLRYSKMDESNLTFVGFIAFLDPPKEDVYKVIHDLASIGVEVKIITGDNHLVTLKICSEIGLPVKGLIQGYEMDTLSDEALRRRVMGTTIFTRFSPDQKNRVINALKANHHSVGYLGDGINDAPSLKAADIGISVNSATDVAKDSADIILTEKNLLVLKEGILEGRKTFGNTMKYVQMGLSSNFGNMFSVAVATLFLPFLPMLPVQILINNFLYDTSQIAIPLDNVDESYLLKPQRWDLKLIYKYMVIYGLTSSVFDLLTFWLLFKIVAVNESQFRTGWFIESLATQILVVFVIRTHHSPFYKSRPSKTLILSTLLCLAIGWILPYMPFASKIGFSPLPFQVILYILLFVIFYLACAELVKRIFYKPLVA